MTISSEFISIIKKIGKKIEFPAIEEIFFPNKKSLGIDGRKSNFGAIKLTDGSIGIVYTSLSQTFDEEFEKSNLSEYYN